MTLALLEKIARQFSPTLYDFFQAFAALKRLQLLEKPEAKSIVNNSQINSQNTSGESEKSGITPLFY